MTDTALAASTPQDGQAESPEAKAVIAELRKCTDLTEEQILGVDATMIARYLRARHNQPVKAAKMLHRTLTWRKEFNVASINMAEFSGRELPSGRMYIAGNDPTGKSILVTRKRSDAFQAGEYDAYLRFLVFTLETSVRAMKGGQEKWVWLMDMKGYSRANSPPLGVSMATLRILADHYPERLHRCYFIDAPGIFSILFNALWPFIDPVTRAKIVFVNSKDHQAAIDSIDGAEGEAKEAAIKAAAAPADQDQFVNYLRWYCEPYNEAAYRELLKGVGW